MSQAGMSPRVVAFQRSLPIRETAAPVSRIKEAERLLILQGKLKHTADSPWQA